MKLKKSLVSLGLLAVVGLFAYQPVLGAEIVVPTHSDPNVVISSQQEHKNLYTGGGNVTVNSDVLGDLTAAGGMIVVTGNVEKEALIAGGTLELSGSVGSHARLAGGNITVNGSVGGDLVVAGGNVNLSGKASVAGDLLIAGGNVIIDAPVVGDIRVAGGNVTINAKVGGNVYARTGQNLIFGSQADITGKIQYTGPQAAIISSGAKVGPIQFTQKAVKSYGRSLAGLLTLAFLIKFLAWLLAAFVMVKLRKNRVLNLVQEFKQKPWENLGYGALFLIVGPILTVLLFVTFVGYYLAFLFGIIYALVLVAANLLSAIVLGYFLLERLTKTSDAVVDWQAILVGVVVWLVLKFIPILGWLAMGIIFLMVLGAAVKKLKVGSSTD